MPNQVTNNIQIEGNEQSHILFSKICTRLKQTSEDKITQIPALLWKNSYKGTIAWNYRHMKCRWAVVEKTGKKFICILSGRQPADGIHQRLFTTLKKVDNNVVIINDYHDTDEKFIGTRILYHDYKIHEELSKKEIKNIIDKDDLSYYDVLSDMKKTARYRAEGTLYELKKMDEGGNFDDDEI